MRGIANTHSAVEIIRGFDASRRAVVEVLGEASLLTYSGHSALDSADARSAAIHLDGTADGPNSISAIDIAMSPMRPGALVVLSSCESSIGDTVGGIGLRGLTSAFLIAGAGAVVGSLWEVDSESTTDLMLDFHRNIAMGLTIDEALRQAQIAAIRRNPHPYYWSGFNVMGNRTMIEPAAFLTPTATAALSR
jgi:CHAT domain-containing protein